MAHALRKILGFASRSSEDAPGNAHQHPHQHGLSHGHCDGNGHGSSNGAKPSNEQVAQADGRNGHQYGHDHGHQHGDGHGGQGVSHDMSRHVSHDGNDHGIPQGELGDGDQQPGAFRFVVVGDTVAACGPGSAYPLGADAHAEELLRWLRQDKFPWPRFTAPLWVPASILKELLYPEFLAVVGLEQYPLANRRPPSEEADGLEAEGPPAGRWSARTFANGIHDPGSSEAARTQLTHGAPGRQPG
jgi:hypothetical protein